MQRVLKYSISTEAIEVPDGRLIHFGEDPGGTLCLWVEVSENETSMREYKIVGTGHQYSAIWTACASVKQGQFMWHLIWRAKA